MLLVLDCCWGWVGGAEGGGGGGGGAGAWWRKGMGEPAPPRAGGRGW